MKIDDAAFVRAFGAQPRGGMDRARWENMRFAVVTYLAELPEPGPGRDRIAVSRFNSGDAVCELLEDGDEPDWTTIESVIDWEMGQAARYIVRANVPPPAELVPIEVAGTVEEVGP